VTTRPFTNQDVAQLEHLIGRLGPEHAGAGTMASTFLAQRGMIPALRASEDQLLHSYLREFTELLFS
jgi:hypothetical protein